MDQPKFEALYHGDRLKVVNQHGDVGVVTLWSPMPAALRKLTDISPDLLDPSRSRIAVISNLYGDGMYAMFCNLLFNPQIRHLVAIGESLGLPTCREIESFLERGLDETSLLGATVRRIRDETRFFPAHDKFDELQLRKSLTFRFLGRLSDPDLPSGLPKYLQSLPECRPENLPKPIEVDLQEFRSDSYAYRPSEMGAHHVVRRRALDCWEELVARGMRFGRPVQLRTGPRLELLNAKAVITEPAPEAASELARYGFDLGRFEAYQKSILEPLLPEGISYTYGNRLRGYFKQPDGATDTLAAVIDMLLSNPESRRAYISLWDTKNDLPISDPPSNRAVPCLATLFFRRVEDRLTLTATYRVHNLLTAWLENVYGLMAIQRYVADALDLPVGAITVVSHSLGIDPRSPRFELARAVADEWSTDEHIDRSTGRHFMREDPNGYFVVSVDEEQDCIVAEHRFAGLLIKQYRSSRAALIERQIIGDLGVSLVSHAMWLGRELANKEHLLRNRRRDARRADRDGKAAG